MSPRSPRKRNKRKAEGAKAPEATSAVTMSFDEFMRELHRRLHPEQPLVRPSEFGGSKLVSAPANPPYKGRLSNILQGLQELNSMQRAFAEYLNPDGPSTTNAVAPPIAPSSMDDLLSYIENELNLSHIMYSALRNKF